MIDTIKQERIEASPIYDTIQTYISEIFGEVANKAIYKDPYIFAYISQKERIKNTIAPYLIGFTDTEGSIEVITNAEGVIYISNVGYFKTGLPNEALQIDKSGNQYRIYKSLSEENFEEIKFDFESLMYTDIIPLEVTAHPNELVTAFLLNEKFSELNKEDICSSIIINSEMIKINTALSLIQAANSSFLNDINQHIQRIVLHTNTKQFGLTSQAFFGAIFMGYSAENHPLHYVDILVHETAHTMLNALLWNPEEYFLTDIYEPRFKSSFRRKKRGLFFVLHSQFVMIRLIEFFFSFYKKMALYPEYSNEVIGRLIFYMDLLNKSIATIDSKTLYTKKGYDFYVEKIKEKYTFYWLETEHLRQQYSIPLPENDQIFFKTIPTLKEA